MTYEVLLTTDLIKLGVAEVVHQDFVHWDLGHLTGLFPRSPLLMLILNPHITSYYNHSTHHNHHSTQITGTLGLTADLWQLLRLLLGATLQQPDTRSARDQHQAKRCRKSSTEVRKISKINRQVTASWTPELWLWHLVAGPLSAGVRLWDHVKPRTHPCEVKICHLLPPPFLENG